MKFFLTLLFICSAAFGQKLTPLLEVSELPPLSDADLAAATLVIFNENDVESTALAGFYAEKRSIPAVNLVGVKCVAKEEVNRAEYDQLIAEPIREMLVARKLWVKKKEPDDAGGVKETKVRFAVVMKGVPLKIAATGPYAGDDPKGQPEIIAHNEASVDSELAVLGLWTRTISGALANPYWRGRERITSLPLQSQLLVCRLDAPQASTVRRMIEDSLFAEQNGLRGFVYVDGRGITKGGLALGDTWMSGAAIDARKNGLPVIQDAGADVFPGSYPMRHAALYFGWYAENITGALAHPEFRFVPGAVAFHLHSFSASSLQEKGRWWCGPLLEAGAAATIGNVYEPFLGLTSNVDVFAQRLREGFTFAEAAYMSQRYLSWMTTFVGDPLYRPFKFLTEGKGYEPSNEWDAYRAGVREWLDMGRASGEEKLTDAARRLSSGPIYEGLGLLLLASNDPKAASGTFAMARSAYISPGDKIRVAIHEAGAIQAAQGREPALEFIKRQISVFSNQSSVEVLKLMQQALSPTKSEEGESEKAPKKKAEPTGAAKKK